MVGIKGGTYYADRQKEKRNAEVAAGDAGETKRQKARMDADTSSGRARGDVVGDGDRGSPIPKPKPGYVTGGGFGVEPAARAGRALGNVVGDGDRSKPKAARAPAAPKPKPSTGSTREYPKSGGSLLGGLFGRNDERDRLLTARNTGSYAKGGKVKC